VGPWPFQANTTIAREEKDEAEAKQDEFLLQAKWGGIDPKAKCYKWH
jgi:hypothetical protein